MIGFSAAQLSVPADFKIRNIKLNFKILQQNTV